MSIITKGLGSPSLITKGYGFWGWLKKKIEETVSHFIPHHRKKVLYTVQVTGDVLFPSHELMRVQVIGKRGILRLLEVLEDENGDSILEPLLKKLRKDESD